MQQKAPRRAVDAGNVANYLQHLALSQPQCLAYSSPWTYVPHWSSCARGLHILTLPRAAAESFVKNIITLEFKGAVSYLIISNCNTHTIMRGGASMCWQTLWELANRARLLCCSIHLTWDHSSPTFCIAECRSSLQQHTACFQMPLHGSSFAWLSHLPP